MLRFANMEVLARVAPASSGRWRHVPTILLVTSLVLLTTAMAGPTSDIRIPLNRAVVMLVIDVSESMASNDVPPNRLAAAQEAGKQFADQLTPAINLGLVEFAANATLLVPPTTNRGAVKSAIDGLLPLPKTATGEGIFTALQAIATVGAVMGGGEGPPPARIVLESDGAENVPLDPNAPQGAFTAARAAKSEGVQISTISFGTPYGTVVYNGADDSGSGRRPNPAEDLRHHRRSVVPRRQPGIPQGRLYDPAKADRLRNRARRRQRRLDAARCGRPGRRRPGRSGSQSQAARLRPRSLARSAAAD